MKCDIILAGVGGQGILTIAYLLDNAAVAKGLRFKQAEVHGMAQRGGAVYSHMRLADHEVISDLVPEGKADMILSVEPLEVQRYLGYLNPRGVVVSSDVPHKNIADYPDDARVRGALLALPRSVVVDSAGIARSVGQPKAENMVMVGAATPFLPFTLDDFEPFVRHLFSSKGAEVVDGNLAALKLGWRVGALTKALLDAGIPSSTIGLLIGKVDPATLEPALAPDLAGLLRHDGAVAVLGGIEGRVPCDAALLKRLG